MMSISIAYRTHRALEKVAERNAAYYGKYPEDIRRVKDLIKYIQGIPVPLPGGGRLSALRLRQLGMQFGFHGEISKSQNMPCADSQSEGGIDTVHGEVMSHFLIMTHKLTSCPDLICHLASDLNQFGYFTRPTMVAFEGIVAFDTAPLYALMHEPIYARGYAKAFIV